MSVRRWRPGDDPAELAAALARGAVLVIPTESSYGLAVDPRDAAGVAAIYRLKGREAGKPLPVVVAGVEQLALLGIDPGSAAVGRLARCWPAALTAVLPLDPAGPAVPAAAGGGDLAVRVPDHAPLRRLLGRLGPLTATSANPSGAAPLLDPGAVARLLAGTDAVVVDGGRLPGGLPSTLVVPTADGYRLLRPGRCDAHRLARCLGPAPA